MLLQRFGSHGEKEKKRWKKEPVLDVLRDVIECVEGLLWDSGELTVEMTSQRQRIMTQITEIKIEVEKLIG